MADDEFLTVDELVERWGGGVSRKTLAGWRVNGRGPDFVKAGRAVLYPLGAVTAFERTRQRLGSPKDPRANGLLEAIQAQAEADPAFRDAIKALAAWGFSTRHVTPTAYLPLLTRVVVAALAEEWARLAEQDKLRPGYPKRPR